MRDREHFVGSAWSNTLACMDAPCAGTGRFSGLGRWPHSGRGLVPERRGAVAVHARTREVRLRQSSDEVCEQRVKVAAEQVERRAGAEGERGPSSTHAPGRRAGEIAKPRGWAVYDKQQRQGRRNGLPGCSTMLASTYSQQCLFLAQAECGAWPSRSHLGYAHAQDLEGEYCLSEHAPIHRCADLAPPSRWNYIAKPDGRLRSPWIAALEDKIAQRALVEALTPYR